MKKCVTVVFALALLALPGVCPAASDGAASPEALKKSLETIKAELGEIYHSAGELLEKEHKVFMSKADAHRKKLDEHVDTAEKKVSDASEQTQKKSREYIDALKKKGQEWSEDAKKTLDRASGDLTKKLKESQAALDARIEKTMDSVDSMSQETRENLARQLGKLQQENQKIKTQLKKLGDRGAASWKDLKKVIQDLWKGLQNTYGQYLG